MNKTRFSDICNGCKHWTMKEKMIQTDQNTSVIGTKAVETYT